MYVYSVEVCTTYVAVLLVRTPYVLLFYLDARSDRMMPIEGRVVVVRAYKYPSGQRPYGWTVRTCTYVLTKLTGWLATHEYVCNEY